jgi:hypothetical protein
MSRRVTVAILLSASLILCAVTQTAPAQTLVGDPFTHSYTGWTDAFPPPTRFGNWRLNLLAPTLMETNNLNPPTQAVGGTNTGLYEPNVLFQNNFLAPGTYDFTARMRTSDDDIVGMVWNYLDPNNYFRVGIRTQAAGTFGGTQGVAVQKIVGGVLTQLNPAVVGPGALTPITQAMINGRTPFDLKVAVNGSSYDVLFNNVSIASGTDAALVPDRKIGFQSWAQLSDTDEALDPLFYGTEVETLSVTQGANNLYSESFRARPQAWRQVVMSNTGGLTTTANSTTTREPLGNFGISIDRPWIVQNTNGNLNATATTPNTDFLGPAVAFDGPGATSLTDYEMKVRLGMSDNDGIGVLVRVLDDNNFYRINFTAETLGAGVTTRPSHGLSVQKVRNGVWSQLLVDTSYVMAVGVDSAQTTPLTGLPMHDLSVKVIGDTIKIQLIDNLGVLHDYPLITDSSNPIPSGSVGLATWGSPFTYFMGYGGQSGPLVVAIPEPATAFLGLMAAVGMCSLKRRRAG